MLSQRPWYAAEPQDQGLDQAAEAFEEAKIIFNELTNDFQKRDLIQQVTSYTDIEALVTSAKSKYDATHRDQKVSKWLSKLALRVRFYGSIMDVMSQHHPEYVSLAWGAMKLVFVLVENHGKLISTLAKALTNIADSLPRVDMVAMLYPTSRMRHAVAQLYAHIMRFFIRAVKWYSASKSHHVWDSLARPVELRYADILGDIEISTKEVENLATAASWAEQRDVHLEILKLARRIEQSELVLTDVRQLMVSYQAINSSAQLSTNSKLTDLQCNEVIKYVSGTSRSDHTKSLQYAMAMARQSTIKSSAASLQMWLHPKFERWKSDSQSAILAVRGDYLTRFHLRDTCVKMIELLKEKQVPVIWALRPASDELSEPLSTTEIIKDLVNQMMKLTVASHTESSLSIACARIRAAETEYDWFDILTSTMAAVRRVTVIIDVVAAANLDQQTSTADFSWIAAFEQLFQKLTDRNLKAVIKVILVGYGAAAARMGNLARYADITINTKRYALARPTRATQRKVLLRAGTILKTARTQKIDDNL